MKLKQLICLLLQHCCSGPAAVPPLRRRQRRKQSRLMPGWTRLFRRMLPNRWESRSRVEDLTVPDQTAAVGGANFALDLLRGAAKPDATTILSPYSALLALGMAANGAGGRTLEEMEYALARSWTI